MYPVAAKNPKEIIISQPLMLRLHISQIVITLFRACWIHTGFQLAKTFGLWILKFEAKAGPVRIS